MCYIPSMLLLLPLLLLPLLLSCATAADMIVPPAVPNPLIKGPLVNKAVPRVPLCADSLSPEQYEQLSQAVARWAVALPELNIMPPTRKCLLPEPSVRVDPGNMPAGANGWTDPRGIKIRSAEVFEVNLLTHEFGHWLGLIRHCEPPESPGVMCKKGHRGDYLPSPEDVAILRRTYFGKVSAANILE